VHDRYLERFWVRERGVVPDFNAHMMQQMAAYASSNITTELIQKVISSHPY
jgi:hypothetical protein